MSSDGDALYLSWGTRLSETHCVPTFRNRFAGFVDASTALMSDTEGRASKKPASTGYLLFTGFRRTV